MKLEEVMRFLWKNQKSINARQLIEVANRLAHIGLFERDVPDAEREAALKLLPGIDADIETALKDNPVALAAYKQAAADHRGRAPHLGVGSLLHKMQQQGVGQNEVIAFITRPEHAELLPAYLAMLEPDTIRDVRAELLQALSSARGVEGEGPLQVLNRLANSKDGSLALLLDGRQLGAISRAHHDPQSGEAILYELGVSKGS
jgi:hypothetical protein